MKTIAEVIKQYRNRQNNPEFSQIAVKTDEGNVFTYIEILNLETVYDKNGRWLEFDCTDLNTQKMHHIKMHGWVVKYDSIVEQTYQPKYIAENVRIVSIYTHSGKRVEYINLTNLREDKKAYKVEFDYIVNSKTTHVKMNGEIERYEEVIE